MVQLPCASLRGSWIRTCIPRSWKRHCCPLSTTFIHSVIGSCRTTTPKHTSLHTKEFIQLHNINWMKTPAESPDANPIENLWHEMKEYNRREVKPKNKAELVQDIQAFRSTVTVTKCTKYIRHLRKVLPRIIELNGEATGY